MRDPDAVNIQATHKQEGKSRIKADGIYRWALGDKLAVCIDLLDPDQHPKGLVNIATGEVMRPLMFNLAKSRWMIPKWDRWGISSTNQIYCRHLDVQ